MKHISKSDFLKSIESTRRDFQKNYYAMYSSVLNGITTDAALMIVPVDDHLVHRGDGVFESLKCVSGSIYNMGAHLDRLAKSAGRLELRPRWTLEEIADIIVATVRAGDQRECLVRVLLSRGPGSFSANPYDSPETQLYVIASHLRESFAKTHPAGVTAKTSSIPVKHALLSTIKTCNYLLNVLMSKEAVDAGVDFVVAFDDGYLAEGATENIGIVTSDKRLLFPRPGSILPGTTMLRVAELAESLCKSGILAGVEFTDISKENIAAAAEMLVIGTTRDVTAVVEFDGKKVGDGKPGPVQKELNLLLEHDIYENEEILTRVFQDKAQA